jgi:perosamine synthetase
MINLAQPDLNGNELKYVTECMETGWISSLGRFIPLFEEEMAKLAGTKHAIATNNGTTALHLALVALGVGPGDEVIVPTVTYIATANAVAYCGATPVLVDVEPGTVNMDASKLQAALTSKTKGVISAHLYGIPADVKGVNAFCEANGIFHLEDAAESHGATVDGKPVGGWGTAATFSFFGNKIVTTGEGGAVTTDDDELAAQLRLLRGQGMDPNRRYWFPVIGFNYRMTNIQAAIGLAQLERFDDIVAVRRGIAAQYATRFAQIEGLEPVVIADGVVPVPWMQNIYLRDADAARRDAVMASLRELGVDSRPVFYPMHVMPPYEQTGDFAVGDDWSARGISLPMHTALTPEDVDTICDAVARSV